MRPDTSRHPAVRNKGSVLVLLLAVSALVVVLGSSVLTLGYHNRVRVARTTQQMAARVPADAGLTRAIHNLNTQFAAGLLASDDLPTTTDVTIPNFDGRYSYTVSQNGLNNYTLVATGTYERTQITVEGVMKVANWVHEYALRVDGDLILGSFAIVDSYNTNSDDGPLKIGTVSTEADTIKLYAGSHVDGDITVGFGGDPDAVIENLGGSYSGSAYDLLSVPSVPSVVVPDYLVSAASQGAIAGDLTVTTSGKYDQISLGSSETLVIDAPVELYVTGDVLLGNSAQIEITQNGSLTLYVDGNVEGKNGSQFNNLTEDPRRFKLLGSESCQTVELKNSGDMYTVIYAPDADMTLYNSATLWGAVTSKTAELKDNALVHYDVSLRDYEDPVLVTLKLASWREY